VRNTRFRVNLDEDIHVDSRRAQQFASILRRTQGHSMSHFMLIVSDAGSEVSAFEVAHNRLSKSVWPIYKGTRNRFAIAPGDSILVYLGGHKRFSQTIIARDSKIDCRYWTTASG
jgi:hypothetical protein